MVRFTHPTAPGLWISLGIVCLALLAGCTETQKPRPRGFPRMELPVHAYQRFDTVTCPFTFEYPLYGRLVADPKHPCYYDIVFDRQGCRWHITLRDFRREKSDYYAAMEDYRQVVYKHTRKGNVLERELETPHGQGRFYTLYGEVPEPASFYFSDTLRYALIASIYFNTGNANDSLQPAIRHLTTDLEHMVATLRFKR